MFEKYCEAVSCDGVKEWYDSRNKPAAFVFWTLVMTTLTGVSIWFTYRTTQGYVDSPRVTTVDTVSSSAMVLPDVMLCYNGGLNVSSFKEFNFTDEFIYAFQSSLGLQTFGRNLENAKELIAELQNFLNKHKVGLTKLADNFGFNCKDFVSSFFAPGAGKLSCEYAEQWFTDSGKCFVFKNRSQQIAPFVSTGYQLELRQPRNSFFEIFPNLSLELRLNNDFKISVEKDLINLQSLSYVPVPVKTTVQIILNPKRYIRLDEGNRCTSHPSANNPNLCYVNCWISTVDHCCNCTSLNTIGLISNMNKSICNPFMLSWSSLSFDYLSNCNNQCKPLCDAWMFDPTVTYSPLDSSATVEPISLVSIGYNTMQYVKIEEVKAFTVDMAISNIGGQPGLWLGVSAVTVVQVVYYSLLAVYTKCTEEKLLKISKK